MRRWWPFVLPFVGIVAAGLVARFVLTSGPLPCDDYVAVEIDQLDTASGCVRVTGQAHYEVVVKQTIPGNLLTGPQTQYLFPLFPEHAIDDRAIRVLVRTERPPEALVSFETMRVSGRLIPLTPMEVPQGTEVEIGKRSNYFFTDAMVLLVPDVVASDGTVWTRGASTVGEPVDATGAQ